MFGLKIFNKYPIKDLVVGYLGVTIFDNNIYNFCCKKTKTRNIIICRYDRRECSFNSLKDDTKYYYFNEYNNNQPSGVMKIYKWEDLYNFLLNKGYQIDSEYISHTQVLELEDTFNDMLEEEEKKKQEKVEDNSEIHDVILRDLVNLGKLANELDDEETREKIKKEIEQLGTFYVTELFKTKTNISKELILPNPLDRLKMDCIKRMNEIENEIKQKKENNTLEMDLQKLQRSLRS